MKLTSPPPSGIITLTTDFGTADLYVGVMKGVICRINPHAKIIDITHAIPPQDIKAAAFLIESAHRYFPEGTIHVVVVDPGVGSDRGAMVCRTRSGLFVCPDNGLLTHILRDDSSAHLVAVENPAYCLPRISNTFHGRDIFAPVAAHLSRGVLIDKIGRLIANPVQLSVPTPQVENETITGHVIWIDHFGNLVTNITSDLLEAIEAEKGFIIQEKKTIIHRLNRSYAESAVDEILAIIGSFGCLEISINQGNAAQTLGLKRGDPITIRKSDN